MADNSTQVLNGNVPTQESSYTTNEHLEEMSPTLVIVSDYLSEIFNEVQFLNESVTSKMYQSVTHMKNFIWKR